DVELLRGRRLVDAGGEVAGAGGGLPVDAPERVAGTVFAEAGHAERVLEDAAAALSFAERAVGREAEVLHGVDAGEDEQVVNALIVQVAGENAEEVGGGNGGGANLVVAAVGRFQRDPPVPSFVPADGAAPNEPT